MSVSAISFQDVYQSYRGREHPVLNGLSLEIPQSQFCVILGRSGMGKSTLLRCINGLVQPYAGTVRVGGETLTRDKAALRRIRRKAAMIFQNYNLVNRLTALENVLCGMLSEIPSHRAMLGLFTEAERARALELLRKVGLEEFAQQRADQLSGGQKQRVGIARAIMQHPKLILCDEPIASLDPKSSKVIMDHLKSINQTKNITCLVNLHQVDVAMKYSERIIGVTAGKIVYDGPTSGLTKEIIHEIYQSSDHDLIMDVQG